MSSRTRRRLVRTLSCESSADLVLLQSVAVVVSSADLVLLQSVAVVVSCRSQCQYESSADLVLLQSVVVVVSCRSQCQCEHSEWRELYVCP